jgi:hypothetical protein
VQVTDVQNAHGHSNNSHSAVSSHSLTVTVHY